ncbi:uncharacterized protein LOC144923558 isoform X2 [Branchiostoma floridae x Branchiostoma belcheri]
MLSHGARGGDLGTTWTASAVVLLPILSSTSTAKQPSAILPATMASKNGNRQSTEELRRRLCKPIGPSAKGVCSGAREFEKQQQQPTFPTPTIVDARSITPEEFNNMAAVATGKVTKGRDGSPTQQREFLQAGQVFLTQNNMNTGFAFASSAPFLTSNIPSYEKHPRACVQESLASLKKGLVDYLSRVNNAKQKGVTERPKFPVEAASQPWAQNGRVGGKPFHSSTKGTAVPAAHIKPLPPTPKNDEATEYQVVSKPQPYPGPRAIHKVPNSEPPEIKPIDLSQANCRQPCSSDNQASLKEEIDHLKEKILETEKDLQKIGSVKDDGLVSGSTDIFQQHEPMDLSVSKKSKPEAPVSSSATDLHSSGKDCPDSIIEGKRSLRASTKTDTLATRNSFLQAKRKRGKRKPSIELHLSGESEKHSPHNGLPVKYVRQMMLPDCRSTPEKAGTTKVPVHRKTDKAGISSSRKRQYDRSIHPGDRPVCPTVGKHGRLDEMVQALSKRLGDAYNPWYGIDYR